MATATITKNEFKLLLNNGVSPATGAVKTNTVKVADLTNTAVDATSAAALVTIANNLEPIFSKSVYDTVAVQTSSLSN